MFRVRFGLTLMFGLRFWVLLKLSNGVVSFKVKVKSVLLFSE